jgi:hypothetical protein
MFHFTDITLERDTLKSKLRYHILIGITLLDNNNPGGVANCGFPGVYPGYIISLSPVVVGVKSENESLVGGVYIRG